MSPHNRRPPTFREEVRRAADEANLEVNDYERGIILGQLAALLQQHSRIGSRIVFKGGAIAHLVDESPRLSKDLDSTSLQAGDRIEPEYVREALTSESARRVVKRVGDIHDTGGDRLLVPVIVCHPLSGTGEVAVEFTIRWDEPVLLDPETETLDLPHGAVEVLVMRRVERVAEKVRAFLMRGVDRDAFDLYHFSGLLGRDEWSQLRYLVQRKIDLESRIEVGFDVRSEFDRHMRAIGPIWATQSNLLLLENVPSWESVADAIRRYVPHLPSTKNAP